MQPISLRSADAENRFAGKLTASIQGSFWRWLRSLDPARRKATTTAGSFIGIAVMGYSGLAVAAFAPGIRDFFSLRFVPPAICFLPVLALGFVMGWLEKRNRISLFTFGWMSLLGAGLFQFYMWSVVAFSELPGAALMAAFPILLASFHGHLYHSRPRYPFPLLVSIAAAVCGLLLNPDLQHSAIMCIAAPTAIGSGLILGAYGYSDYTTRRGQAALREAIDAQILEDSTKTVQRITATLNEVRGWNHDAGNALSGLLIMVPQFISLAGSKTLTPEKLREAASIAESLLKSLTGLQRILEETRQAGLRGGPEAVQVAPYAIADECIAETKRQFPGVVFGNRAPAALRALSIPFFGGSVALRRVLCNVLLNACQGNGDEESSVVEVDMLLSVEEATLVIAVLDNGPGFSETQLSAPLSGFQTTKKSGTGLGLYTVSRVLKANNGSLVRANRSNGRGAEVTISLKLDTP